MKSTTIETKKAGLYDYPKYYDLVYSSDWKPEFDFLKACFRQHALRPVRKVFEPACGTGRLLYRLAIAGFEVSGIDLNDKTIDFCNRRLRRHGFPATAWVGDMADFRLPHRVDAAFNAVGSFRHLLDEPSAESHLRLIAESLAPGGIYMLGLHLTPTRGEPMQAESWSARRGPLSVTTHMQCIELDRTRRREVVSMSYDVHTPARHVRLEGETTFRTYTAAQFRRLLTQVLSLELVATYDYAYRIDRPIQIDAETEDVVWVLRKR